MRGKFEYTAVEDLPTRAQNIIYKLGGIEQTLIYYQQNSGFLFIEGTGEKTNFELCSLCEHLIKTPHIIQDNTSSDLVENIPLNILECIGCYVMQRNACDGRVLNYLNRIETESYFAQSTEHQTLFLLKYFLDRFQFINVQNIGEKTVSTLEEISNEIKKVACYTEELIDFDDFSNDLVADINRKLSYKIPKEEIEKTLGDNKKFYDFAFLFEIYFNQIRLHDRIRKTIDICYFSNNSINIDDLAVKINCGKERVRQILIIINDKILPNALNHFKQVLRDLPNNVNILAAGNILEIDPYLSEIQYRELVPNRKYFHFVYSYYLKENYIHINVAVFDQDIELKSFQYIDKFIYISLEFIDLSHFREFIKWIDTEIYNFETIEFSYDMSILIERFFNENGHEKNSELISTLRTIVEYVLRIDWSEEQGLVLRNKRKQKKEEIVGFIHAFISDQKAPQKTADIVAYLQTQHITISKIELLNLLNRNVTTVNRVGNGYWTIEEYSNGVHGSLREIVADKLFECSTPMHISQLLEYVNTLRPVNERSLMTNLKMDEDKRFIFFNCSFIGLSSKMYESYWQSIPKTIATTLRLSASRNNTFKNIEEKIEYLSKKYGYPAIHVRYLLNPIE